jgi:hypothetical protein
LEWLFRAHAIERARATDVRQNERFRRARAAADLGDSALEQNPSEDGAYLGVACELYREAVHFTLLALTVPEHESRASGPLQGVERSLLLEVAGSETELLVLERLLGTPSFVEFDDLPAGEQAVAAATLARFARKLWKAHALAEQDVSSLMVQRVMRSLGALLLFSAIVVFAVSRSEHWLTERADLARGKPWRASSELIRCDRSTRSCGEFRELPLLFHTIEEPSPWFEIDLGAEREFSRVVVRNRNDCCSERALPLVIEVSKDQTHFREVMRRTAAFSTWTARFSRERARFVRLRVARTSILHLEDVKVLP